MQWGGGGGGGGQKSASELSSPLIPTEWHQTLNTCISNLWWHRASATSFRRGKSLLQSGSCVILALFECALILALVLLYASLCTILT